MVKKIVKGTAVGFGGLVGLIALFLLTFTLLEYTPKAKRELTPTLPSERTEIAPPTEITVVSWNIGYAGLDKNADFIMEGGKMGVPSDRSVVEANITAVTSFLDCHPSDVYFLQEVDRASSRSFYINQLNRVLAVLPDFFSWFAPNFKVLFVPSPTSDPIGRVDSGLLTLSRWNSTRSVRYQLPGEYSWPTRIFHLKRCVSLIRFASPVENRDWILINLHLSAYDSGGTLRKQQLDFVKNLIETLFQEGHYVIVGGDWNSMFPGVSMDTFGTYTTSTENLFWLQSIKEGWTPDKWQWAFDKSLPTCRTLEKPYIRNENFTTIIDGFLISPNVHIVETNTFNLRFENSDHNPIMVRVKLTP